MSKTYSGYPPKDAYGNIDPEWADEQCHKHDLEQYVADQKYIQEQLGGNNNDYNDYETTKTTERAELDARFEFLKAHSDNPEDLKLAKKILKMRDQYDI